MPKLIITIECPATVDHDKPFDPFTATLEMAEGPIESTAMVMALAVADATVQDGIRKVLHDYFSQGEILKAVLMAELYKSTRGSLSSRTVEYRNLSVDVPLPRPGGTP